MPNKLLIYFFAFGLLFFTDFVNAQQSKIDSLERLIPILVKNNTKDSSVIEIYNKLSFLYSDSQPTKSILCAKNALILATKTNLPKQEAEALKNIGVAYYNLSDYEKAIEHYLKALEVSQSIGFSAGAGDAYNGLAISYSKLHDNDKSLDFHIQAYDIRIQATDSFRIAQTMNNIGIIYMDKNEFTKAFDYFTKTLEIQERINYKNGMSLTLNNLGTLHYNKELYDEALTYFEKAILISEEIDKKSNISFNLYNIGSIYLEKRNFEKALQNFNRSLTIAKTIQSNYLIQHGYGLLSDYYSVIGKYDTALDYYKLYKDINDSIFNEQSNRQISEMQTRYETNEKDRHIEYQNATIKQKNNLLTFFIIGTLIILFLFLLLLFQYKQKDLAYRKLVSQNLEIIEQEKKLQAESIKKEENKKVNSVTVENSTNSELYFQLIEFMDNEKPYLENDITIEILASRLNSNRTYISKIIKEFTSLNYNAFINNYRIKEARRMLSESGYKHYSIEGIAQTVGFNSKSTFNTLFKSITGLTPSYFRKSIDNKTLQS